jgi:uncharacterized protein (TIGR00369 family)
MSFESLVEKAGSFKALFARLKASGENVEEQVQQAFEDSRIFKFVGFGVVKVDEGSVRMSFPFSENITRWGGMVHGGVGMMALDTACGMAVMTVNSGKNQVTIELKVNFLEPLTDGPFDVMGRVVRNGRTVVVAEGEIRDSKGVLCAKGMGTWLTLGSTGS